MIDVSRNITIDSRCFSDILFAYCAAKNTVKYILEYMYSVSPKKTNLVTLF